MRDRASHLCRELLPDLLPKGDQMLEKVRGDGGTRLGLYRWLGGMRAAISCLSLPRSKCATIFVGEPAPLPGRLVPSHHVVL
jgi:hypothetical protein